MTFSGQATAMCNHVKTHNRGRCRSILQCTRGRGHDGEHQYVVSTRCTLHGPSCPHYPFDGVGVGRFCPNGCIYTDHWMPVLGCNMHALNKVKEEPVSKRVDEVKRDNGGPPTSREPVSHYTTGSIETIDYIFDALGYEQGMAYILGNILKYGSRANDKGQRRSDITKIRNYATIALEQMDKQGESE